MAVSWAVRRVAEGGLEQRASTGAEVFLKIKNWLIGAARGNGSGERA